MPQNRDTTAEIALRVERSMDGSVVRVAADLVQIAALAGRPSAREDLAGASLEALGELVPHDVGALCVLSEGALLVEVVIGEGAQPTLPGSKLPLPDLAEVRAVLKSGRPAVLSDPSQRATLGDLLYAGEVKQRPERSTLLVPLLSGPKPLGLIVLDANRPGVYPPDLAAVAAVYGHLVGLGLRARQQVHKLELYRDRLEEYTKLLERESRPIEHVSSVLDDTRDPAMRTLVARARQVAVSDAPVLILGETGVGKEVLARAIHEWSPRRERPFVSVNCGAIPKDLVESELFGHVKGAFTGASQARHGRFALADGGTLLLDEIGEMPHEVQVKLLRVLQEGTLQPVGSDRDVNVDVRVLAATHVDLGAAVDDGAFREDLYYRLAVFPIEVPPLRERLVDLPGIVRHLLDHAADRTGEGPWVVSPEGVERLRSHSWPGNIRELANTLERARILSPGGGELQIELDALQRRRGASANANRWPTLTEHVREYIVRVLVRTKGQVWGDGGAAELLGMNPTTLQSRLKKYGIDRNDYTG